MTTLSIIPILQRFCTRRIFKDWAPYYEYEVAENGYSAASAVAEAALPLIKPAMQITDLGIGTGLVAQTLKKHQPSLHMTGLDISQEMLQHCAIKECANILARCDVGAAEWPMANNTQDVMTAAGLFEYLTQSMLYHVFKEAQRTLKPGGFFIFAYLPSEKKKPTKELWDGRSGKVFACAYPPHWLEEKVTLAGFDIAIHQTNFTGSTFKDGSSYDYRLMVLIKRP